MTLLAFLIQVSSGTEELVSVLACNGSINNCDVYEGEHVNFDASLSKTIPGSSIIMYRYNFGDGTIYMSHTESMVTYSYPDNGLYTATLTITDSLGRTDTTFIMVNVLNKAPTVGLQYTISDKTVDLTSNIFDVSKDIESGMHVEINWGDGTENTIFTAYSNTAQSAHIYNDYGQYIITVTVTDNAGDSGKEDVPIDMKGPCKCKDMKIKPSVSTQGSGKTITVSVPTASGNVNVTDQTYFDLEISIVWTVDLTCTEGEGKCKGKYKPSVGSSTWDVDKKGGTVTSQSHTGNGDITCEGDCGKTTSSSITTTYKATVQKGAGKKAGKYGHVTDAVNGDVTLKMEPDNAEECPGNTWEMKLAFRGDVDADKETIDYYRSDFDGDGLTNEQELRKKTDPLDPNSKQTKIIYIFIFSKD